MAFAKYRNNLPQLDGGMFLADGGMETSLIFHDGVELPYFASFVLLRDEAGREALRRYFREYLDLARARRLGFIIDTATWRANPDWAVKLDIGPSELDRLNRQAVALCHTLRDDFEMRSGKPCVINGVVGPRGDGYRPDVQMGAREAKLYHALQIQSLAAGGADMVSAITMNYVNEAIGIALAAKDEAIPCVVSFTVETDGDLASGPSIGDAITAVEAATGSSPAYYMINCAHPSHFAQWLPEDASWLGRVRGVRANASTKSHAELDESDTLDIGDMHDLGQRYRALRTSLPRMNVVGGCCGTDHRHMAAICEAMLPTAAN